MFLKEVTKPTPPGHIGEPDDIAGACVFLASDATEFIDGDGTVVN